MGRENFFKGQLVRVRTKNGNREMWHDAKVIAPTGRGADVYYEPNDGRRRHILASDIRIIPPTKVLAPPHRLTSAPMTSKVLSSEDVVKLNGEPAPRSVTPPPPLKLPSKIDKRSGPHLSQERVNDSFTPLANFLHDSRFAAGLTQAKLEKKMGVIAGYVSKWERAAWIPNDDTLLMYAEHLELDLNELLSLREKSIPKPTVDNGNVSKPMMEVPVVAALVVTETVPRRSFQCIINGVQMEFNSAAEAAELLRALKA